LDRSPEGGLKEVESKDNLKDKMVVFKIGNAADDSKATETAASKEAMPVTEKQESVKGEALQKAIESAMRDAASKEEKIAGRKATQSMQQTKTEEDSVADKPMKEGDELEEIEVEEILQSTNFEEAIRKQLHKVQLDVPFPKTQAEANRLRDNARQAFKENVVRFKNSLSELDGVKRRLGANPKDETLLNYEEELQLAIRRYISKMRKYLKRYDAAREAIDKYKTVELAQTEKKE